VDLNTIAKEWEKGGLATIPEEKIQKIEGSYLLQEALK